MTHQHILAAWSALNETIHPLSAKDLDSFGLHPQTLAFFRACGLPAQSAPFLSFVNNSMREAETINRLSKIYNLPKAFDHHIYIGSDGSGNPIVVNTKNNDSIELLDHEQNFELLDVMNSDVISLSGCLIAYATFVKTINETNGTRAFLEGKFTAQQFEVLKMAMQAADKQYAVTGFWAMELDMLWSNRG